MADVIIDSSTVAANSSTVTVDGDPHRPGVLEAPGGVRTVEPG